MKLSILMALLLSFSAFANNSYLLSSAFCDGNQINLFEADKDTDLSFILRFKNSTEAMMTVKAIVNQEDFKMTLNSAAPLKFEKLQGDTYKIKSNGVVNCTISSNGKKINCDKDSMVTLSDEDRVWTVISKGPMKHLTTTNYSDEFNTCERYELYFNKISN